MKRNPISLKVSMFGINNSRVNSSEEFLLDQSSDQVPGSIVNIALIHGASKEIEVTHEVFFGENIRRVFNALFGK